MNKKIIALGLTLMISIGVVGCGKEEMKEDTTLKNEVGTEAGDDMDYKDLYTKNYTDNLTPLNDINIFGNNPVAMDDFQDDKYPGNEKYLSDVRGAYQKSRDNISAFVTTLKNDAKTDDAELKKFNEDLIAEGESLLKDIDDKIARLDKISEEDLKKTDEDFLNYVNEINQYENKEENGFEKMIREMNEQLGIDKK